MALVWFDTATSSVSLSRSTVGRTVNSIYVTYDAATRTALGVAANGTSSYLVTARRGDATATTPTTWTSPSPRPIVSRGDGTFYLHDGTSYSLRRVSAPVTVLTRPGDPGSIGAPVVVDGHYAYVYFLDLASDALRLQLYDCL